MLFRFVLSLFFLGGLVVVLFSGYALLRTYQSKDWKQVAGTMLKTECHTTRSGSHSSSHRYVHYRYVVDGKQYESEREYFGSQFSTIGCDTAYRSGDGVVAYYDPEAPSEAVLRRSYYSGPKGGLEGGLIFMGIAAFLYWLGIGQDGRKAGQGGKLPGEGMSEG